MKLGGGNPLKILKFFDPNLCSLEYSRIHKIGCNKTLLQLKKKWKARSCLDFLLIYANYSCFQRLLCPSRLALAVKLEKVSDWNALLACKSTYLWTWLFFFYFVWYVWKTWALWLILFSNWFARMCKPHIKLKNNKLKNNFKNRN